MLDEGADDEEDFVAHLAEEKFREGPPCAEQDEKELLGVHQLGEGFVWEDDGVRFWSNGHMTVSEQELDAWPVDDAHPQEELPAKQRAHPDWVRRGYRPSHPRLEAGVEGRNRGSKEWKLQR
jgi:hypothetical protein